MATRKKRSDPSSEESLVIYVHGIGTQPPSEQVKQQWDLALFGRELGDRSRMAYWSDLLHPPKSSTSAKGKHVVTGQAPDAWRARLDANASAQLDDFEARLLEQLGAPTPRPTSRKRGPGKKVLPLPAWARRPISQAFLKAFIADTAAYFFAPGMRERIQRRLRDAIDTAGNRPITLVAHSHGAIIAYEVMSTLRFGRPRLDALVTIGSPLGIREVQDFIEPAPPSVPTVVPRWTNYADPLDPIALDKSISADFIPSPSGVRVQDEIVVHDQTRNLWDFNPHSAVGYLTHPSVRRAISNTMRIDSMNRFVMARDVAERLGAIPEERHPVLIEVLEPGYGALDETSFECALLEQREQAALLAATGSGSTSMLLAYRIATTADKLRQIVSDEVAARIDPLRRFVAARLTADELQQVAAKYREMRVYAVWQSARKSKLTDKRSMMAIKADAALKSFAADGAGVSWAVLDTGIQADHPHFAGVIGAVYDCTRPGPPTLLKNSNDSDGHGTHVSGIITGQGAVDTFASDLRGVAPRTRLIVYKVLDDDGQGEDSWIIKALDHIAEENEKSRGALLIHGVNLSLGGTYDQSVYGCGYSPICIELRHLWRNGVLVVVACGNEGRLKVQTPDGQVEINSAMSVGDPANLEECIAVGSVHTDRPHLFGISSFSSRGPTADGRAKPDVVAPGERVMSCSSHWRKDRAGSLYRFDSGTSMAAPHVSGLLAAFLSVRREFRGRPDEVKRILLDSCIDLGRDRYHQGRGLPNLMQMLMTV